LCLRGDGRVEGRDKRTDKTSHPHSIVVVWTVDLNMDFCALKIVLFGKVWKRIST
jgi:hypothetical protein